MNWFWSWLATELITVKEGNYKNDVVSWITIVSHSYNHIRSSPLSCRDMQQQCFNYLISNFQISKSVLIQKEYGVIVRKLYFISRPNLYLLISYVLYAIEYQIYI